MNSHRDQGQRLKTSGDATNVRVRDFESLEWLREHYSIESDAQGGGMAQVLFGSRDGLEVAVKVPHSHLLDQDDGGTLRERFDAEIGTLKALRNSRGRDRCEDRPFPTILEHGVVVQPGMSDLPYFAMTQLAGKTLTERIKEERPFSREEIGVIFEQLCVSVQSFHDCGVYHRDIKPSNIFLINHDPHPRVALLDCGIAKNTQAPTLTVGVPPISPAYAPHAVLPPDGASNEEIREDLAAREVYALGTTLYQCLTGENLFIGEISEIIQQQGNSRFIDNALQKYPLKDEYKDVATLLRQAVPTPLDDGRLPLTSNAGELLNVEWFRTGLKSALGPAVGPTLVMGQGSTIRLEESQEFRGYHASCDIPEDTAERHHQGNGIEGLTESTPGEAKQRLISRDDVRAVYDSVSATDNPGVSFAKNMQDLIIERAGSIRRGYLLVAGAILGFGVLFALIGLVWQLLV